MHSKVKQSNSTFKHELFTKKFDAFLFVLQKNFYQRIVQSLDENRREFWIRFSKLSKKLTENKCKTEDVWFLNAQIFFLKTRSSYFLFSF